MMAGHPGSDALNPRVRDDTKCGICGSSDGVCLIEERIAWGAAAVRMLDKGYTGRPVPWCRKCRSDRRSYNWRYSKRKT